MATVPECQLKIASLKKTLSAVCSKYTKLHSSLESLKQKLSHQQREITSLRKKNRKLNHLVYQQSNNVTCPLPLSEVPHVRHIDSQNYYQMEQIQAQSLEISSLKRQLDDAKGQKPAPAPDLPKLKNKAMLLEQAVKSMRADMEESNARVANLTMCHDGEIGKLKAQIQELEGHNSLLVTENCRLRDLIVFWKSKNDEATNNSIEAEEASECSLVDDSVSSLISAVQSLPFPSCHDPKVQESVTSSDGTEEEEKRVTAVNNSPKRLSINELIRRRKRPQWMKASK
ncbi:hypothetical protein P9112_002626 [Eukaryota sp. TZLM1-RC]